MVRVIDPTPQDPKRTICEHCRVKLEYVPNDIQKRTYKDYDGVSDFFRYIICPNCSKEVGV